MTRARHYPNIGGSIDADIAIGATTFSSPALAALPGIAAPDVLWICMDPDGNGGAPEWMKVTAHTSGASTATVTRGEQGTTARAHLVADAVRWVHDLAPTEADAIPYQSIDNPHAFAEVYGADLGLDQEFDSRGATTPPAGWSWVNQGAATYAERFGAGVISLPAKPTAGDDLRMLTRPDPGLAAFEVIAKVLHPAQALNYFLGGMVLREAATGELLTFGYTGMGTSGEMKLELLRWNSPTSINAALVTNNVPNPFPYLRAKKKSATDWEFSVSPDGVGWWQHAVAINPSAYMNIDEVGFFGGIHSTHGARGTDVACHWLRVR